MVSKGRGRMFRRKDGKYLIYLPMSLAEDSMFPFQDWQEDQRNPEQKNSIPLTVSFQVGEKKLIVEERKEDSD